MNAHDATAFYDPVILLLVAGVSFFLAYAAGFVLFTIAKTPGLRLAAIIGLIITFVYAALELWVKTHGVGLTVLMPSGCVGVIVADVRVKLRDAKSMHDTEAIKGWSKTLRILMTIMLPIALIVAMTAGIR